MLPTGQPPRYGALQPVIHEKEALICIHPFVHHRPQEEELVLDWCLPWLLMYLLVCLSSPPSGGVGAGVLSCLLSCKLYASIQITFPAEKPKKNSVFAVVVFWFKFPALKALFKPTSQSLKRTAKNQNNHPFPLPEREKFEVSLNLLQSLQSVVNRGRPFEYGKDQPQLVFPTAHLATTSTKPPIAARFTVSPSAAATTVLIAATWSLETQFNPKTLPTSGLNCWPSNDASIDIKEGFVHVRSPDGRHFTTKPPFYS